MLLGAIFQDSLQSPKGVGPFCEIQDGTKAHFEVVPWHFGWDPIAVSPVVGKLETRLQEDEIFAKRIAELAEILAKGRKRIII